MRNGRIGVGFEGVGDISGIYLKNLTTVFKNDIEIIGICDLVREKAEKAAETYGITKIYGDMYELFADPAVDMILNITRPYEHYEVTKAALAHGKHVYTEKPLAPVFEQAKELVAIAKEKGLLIGGAPDTFMGAGIQTCRKLIDSGFIGKPVGGAAFMICRGHESWHPDPAFYYQYGGGPMLDMGPYYVTALLNLLGGVKSVSGMTQIPYETRVISSAPKFGEVVKVEVPTTVAGTMQFANGALGTIYTTFDVSYKGSARLEIYGSEGTLICPDPNTFGGEIKLLRYGSKEFGAVPLSFGFQDNSRGLGLTDMSHAVKDILEGRSARDFRTSYDRILHAVEVMTSFAKSAEERRTIDLETTYTRPEPMHFSTLPGEVL